MNDEKLERILENVEPGRRAMLKKLVLGASFAVPVIASFSVSELAQADIGSEGTTSTVTVTHDQTSILNTTTEITTTTSTLHSTTTLTFFVTTTIGV